MQATKLNNISIEQYIAIERENDTRYEYHNGEIRISERGTIKHTFICGNIFAEVETELRAKKSSYHSLNHTIKIQIQNENRFIYPDMVVIDKIERSKIYREAIINPVVVVEVLSENTAGYDRGGKFFLYRKIKTLQQYILIEQDTPEIDIYTRNQGDLWHIKRVSGLENSLLLQSLDIEIPLKDVYRNVDFSVSQ